MITSRNDRLSATCFQVAVQSCIHRSRARITCQEMVDSILPADEDWMEW